MKAIVIGRHSDPIPGIDILESRAVTFPATAQECAPVIQTLVAEAIRADAVLLFQNTPGQVAAALVSLARAFGDVGPNIGVIISKPGERLAGVTREFEIAIADGFAVGQAHDAVIFANPRAKVTETNTGIVVTCDPPMRFEFSLIEWF